MEQQAVQVTPEEIINLILEEMEAGTCPSYYSIIVPSVYDVYLFIDDLERLRPLEQRMRDEACSALDEKLAALNKAATPKLKIPLAAKKRPKRYEVLGEWSVEFHENTDDDARENPLVIHSTFPVAAAADDRVGTLTERVTKRAADGRSTTTATERSGRSTPVAPPESCTPIISYEDETGEHTYQMTKDLRESRARFGRPLGGPQAESEKGRLPRAPADSS